MKILIILFLLFINLVSAQEKVISRDELSNFQNEVNSSEIQVLVLKTCSTKSELCGNMAFGSVSVVKILNGNFRSEIIDVATLCKETEYEVNQSYILKISKSPSFGVTLCDHKFYAPEKNNNIGKDNYLFFGVLVK